MSSLSSPEQNDISREHRFRNSIFTDKLYLNDEGADVHFVFAVDGQETLVPAHKILLATCSPVFHAMFFGDIKETGNVKIVDSSADGFKDFLSIFYLNEVKITIENVAEFVYLSDKYDMSKGLEMCEEFLLKNTQVDDLCTHFKLATTFNLMKLHEYCKKRICVYATEIFSSDGFIKSTSKMLNAILQLNDHNCRANDVFEACINWAGKACEQKGVDASDKQNLRRVLGDCFYSIPFMAMELTEFSKLASANRSMFTLDEVLDIQDFITTGTATEITDKFIKTNKQSVFTWDDNSLLTCTRVAERDEDEDEYSFDDDDKYRSKTAESTEYITFSSTHELLFGGLEFNETEQWDGEYTFCAKMAISILQRGESLAQSQMLEKIQLDSYNGHHKPYQFKFDKPIIIKPHVKYTIQTEFDIKSGVFWYWAPEQRTSVTLQPNIRIKFDEGLEPISELISKLHFNRL